MARPQRWRIIPAIVVIVIVLILVASFSSFESQTASRLRWGQPAAKLASLDTPAPANSRQFRSSELVHSVDDRVVPTTSCGDKSVVYPEWPDGFQPNVSAVFIIGEQKSGTTWLWEMLDGHPCLLTAAQPHRRMGAITTKETYYTVSTKISTDARQFLVPWMGLDDAESDAAWEAINSTWFDRALSIASAGTATTNAQFFSRRSYTKPGMKLKMQQCERYFLLEATPHSLHTPIAAARIRKLFPDATAVATLKEPVWRMRSAYQQFEANFQKDCGGGQPASWCPVFKYYQLRVPSFSSILQQEVQYMRKQGCAFEDAKQSRSWMDCYGCAVMDPWENKVSGLHITQPPYAPSAALSMYAPMLDAWLGYFPAEQTKIINYEAMVAEPFEVVNSVLRKIGVEEYTAEHWDVMQPERLGFRGRPHATADGEQRDAEAMMSTFFEPHNAQLAEVMAAQGWAWQPFAGAG